MAPDPRVADVDRFTKVTRSSIPLALNPEAVTLPRPFTVAIIGASAGIGEYVAYAYAHAGASRIVISSRTLIDLQAVEIKLKEIDSTIEVDVVECDVSKAKSVEALAQHVRVACARLDVLVLNAGYAGPITLKMEEGNPDWVQKAFDINAMGTYHAAHYFVPLLLRSKDAPGAFIVVGSIAGCIRRGIIANTGYTVSKMAQIRLVEYLAEQHSNDGLLSIVIHPGAVKTRMAEGNTPEAFLPYLTDDVGLCGAVCVWLTSRRRDLQWLSGRLISATWDMDELLSKKDQVVQKDLLKFALVTE
ncbi:uncharacterized protein A1O9_05329 [Exophiala aquamarina CBS 119918]|uniref:Uncharacterized protein n=1 Tax=Exophiala aquamarina CBS 119918 TaxID=1182545 RepID=A0A072PCC4_9EURO|nr:uncharacterized protein A1O9_05329 [Exophiala aquamarina CBS 119918]KEF57412.1 hypothetical protein A1O9_05329 [Exophiala aquamarina CBS 119918]